MTDSTKKVLTPTTSSSAMIAAFFNTYLGKAPSNDELAMYSKLDPKTAQETIKHLGESKKAEIEAEIKSKQEYAKQQREDAALKVKQDGAGGAKEDLAAQNAQPAIPASILGTGTNHLVMFTDDPVGDPTTNTVWLWNTNNHNLNGQNYDGTLIPFTNVQAFNSFFNGKLNIADAQQKGLINKLPTSSLSNSGSLFYNSRMVKTKDGIAPNGQIAYPPEAMRWRYGQEIDPTREANAVKMLQDVFTIIKRDDPSFTQADFDNNFTMGHGDNLAKYANAVAYGGLSTVDVYKDIMANKQKASGNPLYANYNGINPTQNITDWKATPNYNIVNQGASEIKMPNIKGTNFNWTALNQPIWSIPPAAYASVKDAGAWDINDPVTAEKITHTQSLMEDLAIQVSEADNAQSLAAAKYNWDQFKQDTEKNLGIQLADNVYTAWNQLQTLSNNMRAGGTLNSGIQNRFMDEISRATGRTEQRLRDNALNSEDDKLRLHLLNDQVSDEELQSFIDKRGKDTAEAWGLLPDKASLDYFNIDNLRSLYPDVPVEQLQGLIDVYMRKLPDGTYAKNSVADRNAAIKMRDLTTTQTEAKTNTYLGNLKNSEENAKSSVTSTANPFENMSDQSAGQVLNPTYTGGWAQRVSGENALKNLRPDQFVRTTGNDVYMSNPAQESRLLPSYLKTHSLPKTDNEWKAFHDYVYVQNGVMPDNIINNPANPAANKTSAIIPPTKITQDVKPVSQVGTADSMIKAEQTASANLGTGAVKSNTPGTGFQGAQPSVDTAWEKLKADNAKRDWSGYEKIATPTDATNYTDIQRGTYALYGKKKIIK